MRPVGVCVQFLVYPGKRLIAGECTQQLIMTRTRLVRSGENRIHDAELAGGPDTLCRKSFADTQHAITPRRVLQRPDHSGADGDDSPTLGASPLYRTCGRCRDAIRFIEGQQAVQLRITG